MATIDEVSKKIRMAHMDVNADYPPDSEFDANELERGIAEEMSEHDMDRETATRTAKDHLLKDPHYYSDLEKAGLRKINMSIYNQYKAQ